MTSPYRQAQWLISDYDFQVHAFYHVDETQGVLEALCTHTVPPEKLSSAHDTALTAPTCPNCLIKYGELLAGHVQRWHD